MIYVIKKDGTKELFNSRKIVAAVNKSAARILYTFSEEEQDFICRFAEEHAASLGKNEIQIQEMHNIVEGALERVNPAVAKSYRDYRNYKLDFIHMMDDVYTKSQAIRYIGDKSNANTDSALVATKRSLIFNELNKEKAFCELTNRSQNLLGIEEIAHYVHPDEQARFRKNVSNILHRQRRTAQYRCQFNDTGYQWWEFRYSVLQNNEQNPIITGLLVNIQEIKDKEEELIRARKLAEQAELKQSFLANMSHEIRTPLNAIVGFSNLLTTEKNISEEEKKEFASIIDNNTRLLLKLVNDVLELSRIESGNMSFHCEDCSAHHFAETVYQTHQVIILPPVEFIKEFPDEDVTIHIDRMRLTQVITNFLGNAKKFTSQGHIKLGYFCDKEKKEIHIFVEDTGAGIPKEELQMIFERFYKRNEFVQGVGLGLAISKVIVEKMNGHIDVQSEVNKGSRFTAVLPYL